MKKHEQIAYKLKEGQVKGCTFIETPCPHGKSMRVGSCACANCKHYVGVEGHVVTCSFMGDMSDEAMDHKEDGPNV